MATTKGVAVGRRLRRRMDVAVRSSMIINDYYGREGLAGSGSVVIVVGRRCCAVHGIDVRCPMSESVHLADCLLRRRRWCRHRQ